MNRVLITQSIPEWRDLLQNMIQENLPEIADYISYTDSFDHTLDLVLKKGRFIAIVSNMFHDKLSKYRESMPEKIPDSAKDGNSLAKMIKEINPQARVYVLSEYIPRGNYIDGFIPKNRGDINKMLTLIVMVILKETIKSFE